MNKGLVIKAFIFSVLFYWLSFLAWMQESFALPFMILSALAFVYLSLQSRVIAFGLVLAELALSSFGYLLSWHFLSLRLLLFILFYLIFLFDFTKVWLREKKWPLSFLQTKSAILWPLIVIFVAVLFSLAHAIYLGRDLNSIFSDINAWFYFVLVFPAAYYLHLYPNKA